MGTLRPIPWIDLPPDEPREELLPCRPWPDEIAYTVTVEVRGVPARLLVDTGAGQTTLYLRSAAAHALMDQITGTTVSVSVSGVAVEGWNVEVPGAIAGEAWSVTTPSVGIIDIDDDTCGLDGLLGMDALAHCTLYMGRLRSQLSCGEP